MKYEKISENIFNCSFCPTRCDSVSKGSYIFLSDATFSEKYENLIIEKINLSKKFKASKCELNGYPDIQIFDLEGDLHSYLEVKVQQRTFMTIEKILPSSDLKPSETLALNLSDLLRYFEIKEKDKIKTSIVWVLMNRLCILKNDEIHFYFQDINILQYIYIQESYKRRFRRKSGEGDIVEGIHKGVTVNYHFSINELIKWEPKE
jgi:hypothetical protein